MSLKSIYISGPYSAPKPYLTQRNIHKAWEAAVLIWGVPGAYPVCPHTMTAFMDGAADSLFPDEDYAKFIEADLDLVGKCDAVYMLNDWQGSRGARREREHAIRLGKKVFYQALDGPARILAWVRQQEGDRDPLSVLTEEVATS